MARAPCSSGITAEIERSLDPCAMATTLQSRSPSAPKSAPATPGWWRMPSPIRLRIDSSRRSATASIRPAARSAAKARSSRSAAVSALSCATQTEMAHSLEPWVMRTTLISRAASAAKTRAAIPGTPRMPGPETSSSAAPRISERPRAGRPDAAAPAWTRVPGRSGARLLRTRSGIPCARTGAMVRGCRTLAPKCASSMASSKLSSARQAAVGTTRGSAVKTPSTSVQISSSRASSAAAARAAERSEPPRPSSTGSAGSAGSDRGPFPARPP